MLMRCTAHRWRTTTTFHKSVSAGGCKRGLGANALHLARLGHRYGGKQLRDDRPQIRHTIGPGPYEYDGDLVHGEILLMRQALIHRDEDVKRAARSAQELAV